MYSYIGEGLELKIGDGIDSSMKHKKNIFITGAASGIGRETALLFSKKGWFVGIFDVNEEGLKSLQSEIDESNSCLQLMDVVNLESVKGAVKSFTGKTGGRMDVLFNCAGIVRMGPNEKISINDQKLIVDVNFNGILNCIYFSLDYLKKTPDARIINMSSASAIYGIPELAVYSSTKHAVKGLTEALDIEFEPYGITVSDIIVPYVRTPMVMDALHKAFSVDKMGVNIEPSQVANTIWKAAHGKKVHWKISGALYALLALFWAFPFARRFIVKLLAMSPQQS